MLRDVEGPRRPEPHDLDRAKATDAFAIYRRALKSWRMTGADAHKQRALDAIELSSPEIVTTPAKPPAAPSTVPPPAAPSVVPSTPVPPVTPPPVSATLAPSAVPSTVALPTAAPAALAAPGGATTANGNPHAGSSTGNPHAKGTSGNPHTPAPAPAPPIAPVNPPPTPAETVSRFDRWVERRRPFLLNGEQRTFDLAPELTGYYLRGPEARRAIAAYAAISAMTQLNARINERAILDARLGARPLSPWRTFLSALRLRPSAPDPLAELRAERRALERSVNEPRAGDASPKDSIHP